MVRRASGEQADPAGISLWLDVRNGGSDVQLGERALAAAEVVALEGQASMTLFQAARSLCRKLCPHPRLPGKPIYGSNNWYYLYGENMTKEIVPRDRRATRALAFERQPALYGDRHGLGERSRGQC